MQGGHICIMHVSRAKWESELETKEEVHMKRTFTASVWKEGDWFVAQCLEVDVASQGESEEEALANLREALELHFEEPRATTMPQVRQVEVEVSAA